jgi:hypothetical protein
VVYHGVPQLGLVRVGVGGGVAGVARTTGLKAARGGGAVGACARVTIPCGRAVWARFDAGTDVRATGSAARAVSVETLAAGAKFEAGVAIGRGLGGVRTGKVT